MILQALYQLAETEGLMEDPDYEWKPVAWLVRVSSGGRILGIVGTHYIPPEQQQKKNPKSIANNFKLPREKAVTSGDRAFLLFGKSEYVFGEDPAKERPAEKLTSRFALFRQCVKDCLDATGDEGVHAIWTALEDIAAGNQKVSLPEKYASNDLFAFIYAPDVDKLVSDRGSVRAYWKERRTMKTLGEARNQCLVSGDPFGQAVGNFPPVKRVPGATTSGVALVSFNSRAFESYGWNGNENAPISRDAAETCATALNRLLHPAYPDPQQCGQTLPKRNLRLSADTAVCFWSAEKSDQEFCSAFSGLLEANPDEVGGLYHSIWRGKPLQIEDPSAFYALTITGTQGRVIVRDWFESTVVRVAGNLAAHFADLDIVRNTPKPKERHLPPQIPLTLLLRSLAPEGDGEKIPAPLIGQLVEAALKGTPYPFSVLQRALVRMRAEIGRDDWTDLNRRDARVALIKAVLNRRKRFFPQTTHYKEVQRDMDPNNTSEGYTLGRLMAVLERIQQAAHEDINASVVDRYFSAASATPKSVFVRLLKNSRHHVRKGRDDAQSGGIVFLLDKLVDELADRFDPATNGFPAHLDLEQQGLFVLGYHQMRRWLWMGSAERMEWENTHPSAPGEYLWKTAKSQ